ncbi:MAG: energy transducer TonB [Janthinobacterium lividum]
MLLSLPLLQATLRPSPETWAAMPLKAAGRFCARCQHKVHDFSQLADPGPALAAAPVAPTRLRPQLQQFLVVLVLGCGLGLPAHEALAQVRRAGMPAVGCKPVVHPQLPKHKESPLLQSISGGTVSARHDTTWTYVEEMPVFRGSSDYRLMAAYVQQHLFWPEGGRICVSGKVFVSFAVGIDGLPRDVKVVKGLYPSLDAAVIRAVHMLGRMQPGRKKGRPVAVTLILPVSFNRE